MTEHDVGGRELADQIVLSFQCFFDGRERLGEQALRLSENLLVATVWRQQDRVHHDGIDRRHHHPLAVVEPLEVLGKLGLIDRGLEFSRSMTRQDVLDDGAGFVDLHIVVIEHRNAAQRVTRAMLVGLEILRVEVHPIQLEGKIQLLEQPVDAARPRIRCKM